MRSLGRKGMEGRSGVTIRTKRSTTSVYETDDEEERDFDCHYAGHYFWVEGWGVSFCDGGRACFQMSKFFRVVGRGNEV